MAGILGRSGSVYYAAQVGGADSIIIKESPSGTNIWSIVILISQIAAKSFILSDDEKYISFIALILQGQI